VGFEDLVNHADTLQMRTAEWENDTIRGWGLVTEGPQCEAKQVFLYHVVEPFLVRRDDIYLDAYKQPLSSNTIVWMFEPRGRRGR